MNSWNREPSVIPTRATPSLLYKNLSHCQDKLVIAHGSEVALSYLTGVAVESKKLHLKNHAVIFQVAWATLNDNNYLMIATSEGFELWDAECQRMLHLYALTDDTDPASDVADFCRGLDSIDRAHGTLDLLVGTSSGFILVFEMQDGADVTKTHQLSGHSKPITSIVANKSVTATADDDGIIFLRDSRESYQVEHEVKTDGYPVTDMILHPDYLIASFTTGHIRLFRLPTGIVATEIAAHSRCINGLAFHENQLFSVGEDTYLNVWSIPEKDAKSSEPVDHVFSHRMIDNLPTGIVVLKNGNIVTSTYECAVLYLWTHI